MAADGLIKKGVTVTSYSLTPGQIAGLVGLIVFFAIVEGYIGFHRSWSPVTARRCFLAGLPVDKQSTCARVCVVLAAPVFAGGYFFAPTRRLVMSYGLVAFIVGIIMAVKQLPDPWHQIFDCGVAVGLTMGTLSFCYYYIRCLCKNELPPDVDFTRSDTGSDKHQQNLL